MKENILDMKLKKTDISLIIGCINYDFNKCLHLIEGLGNNNNYIKEIICIVSNVSIEEKVRIESLSSLGEINIKYYAYTETFLPGKARNIGIKKSNGEYIAFLDSSTQPPDNWLEVATSIIKESIDKKMILGRTKYYSYSDFEECFIASTYGKKALYTLPGSLISRSLVNQLGDFLPSIRSGEDVEWIERARYFQASIKDERMVPLRYGNIEGKGFIELCKKWYKYYSRSGCAELLIYQRQRYTYIIVASYIILALAFSWNDNIANWDEASFWYIPHISKITVTLLILIYSLLRAIFWPLLKGVQIFKFSLLNIIRVFFISLSLDIVKTVAFVKASFFHNRRLSRR